MKNKKAQIEFIMLIMFTIVLFLIILSVYLLMEQDEKERPIECKRTCNLFDYEYYNFGSRSLSGVYVGDVCYCLDKNKKVNCIKLNNGGAC